MATQTTIARPAPFVEKLGTNLAENVLAQQGTPIVTQGLGALGAMAQPDKQDFETDKQFEKYFGSSAIVKESTEHLKKEIIAEYDTRAPAKMQEFLLQWQQRHDDCCINDMLHVRIRSSFLKDFEPIHWSPSLGMVHFMEEPDGT